MCNHFREELEFKHLQKLQVFENKTGTLADYEIAKIYIG